MKWGCTPKERAVTDKISRRTSLLRYYREITEQLHHISTNVHRILRLQEQIMSNQEHLDAAVAALGVQFQQVVDEVAALKAQVGADALDFTGLDAAVQQVSNTVPDTPPE